MGLSLMANPIIPGSNNDRTGTLPILRRAVREACAQLCDIRETMFKGYKTDGLAALCAAAIRARSHT